MRRILSRSTLLILVAVFLAPILSMTTLANRLELGMIDLGFKLRGTHPVSDEIVIVAIDDESFQETGFQWPWPRSYFAEVLDTISAHDPAVIAIDIFWYEESINVLDLDVDNDDLPDGDELLAEVIAEAGNVILANDIEVRSPMAGMLVESYNQPIPILEEAAWKLGLANFERDVDGFVRRASIYRVSSQSGETYYSWAALAAAKYLGTELPEQVSGDQLTFGEHQVAVPDCPSGVDGGCLNINYRGRTGDYTHIPAYQIVSGDLIDDVLHERLEGKIVLLGATTETLHDTYPTPFSGSVVPMPGVEIMANTIDTLINGDAMTYISLQWGVLLALVLSVVALMLSRAPQLTQGLIGLAVLMVAYLIGWVVAFMMFDTAIPFSGPLMGLFIGFATPAIGRAVREERARRQIKNAFSFYLSPALVDQLVKNPAQLKLGGERRNMTFLFSDIRSFTTISEQYDAVGLTRLINRFLTPMTDLIMSERGTIDKYMGDCIMAFWNAPLEDPEHAHHACSVALQMRTRLKELNDTLQAEAEAEGRSYRSLKIGIGINSGPCSVGNMGSEQRFDYSVLGDDVNLASRLEGQSKRYGVDIVIGENTLEEVAEFAVIELDLVQVKGKTVPVHIYALLGDGTMQASETFKALKAANDAMLAAYRQQDWDRAQHLLSDCRKHDSGIQEISLNVLYDMYAGRIDTYKANPPGENWNGVFVATSK